MNLDFDWSKLVQAVILGLLTWNLATTQELAVKVAVMDERIGTIMKELGQ